MRHFIRPVLCLLLASLGVGCGENCKEGLLDIDVCDVESTKTFDVGLVNDAELAIHILRDGESFGPENRIAPGRSRTVTEAASSGSEIAFRAGRNGQVVASVECSYVFRSSENSSGHGRLVVYTEDAGPALVCVNWPE